MSMEALATESIAEMVERLCPDGVEHVQLKDVADYVRGLTYSKKDEAADGPIAVLRANNISLSSNTLNFDEVKRVADSVKVKPTQFLQRGDVLICAGSGSKQHVGKVAYIQENLAYAFGGFMAVVRTNNRRVDSKYIFHLLTSDRFRSYLDDALASSTINNLNARLVGSFNIPLPSLEVQREIAKTLELFFTLDKALGDEIEGREKQFRSLRNQMLNFSPEVERVEIENLFTLRNGYTPSKKNSSYWENGTIPWFRMEDIRENGQELSDSIQKIHESAVKGAVFPANSILMATSATIGEHALVTVPHLSNQRFTSMQVKPAYTERLDVRFAHQYAFILDEWCKENTTMSSFASVDMKRFRRFQFPLPPIDIQRQIASDLDVFTDYINNLKSERELRQKQYKGLREHLLTFPRKKSA